MCMLDHNGSLENVTECGNIYQFQKQQKEHKVTVSEIKFREDITFKIID